MATPHPWYRWQGDDLIVEIHLQPRASRNEITAPRGDHLRVRITAPPVDGKANKQLCEFLARTCGVTKRAVQLVAGQTSRYKRIRITAPVTLPPHIEKAGD